LGSDGRLKSSVAAEVNTLRGREQTLNITADEEKIQRQIEAMRFEGCCGEILCAVRRTAEPFSLTLSAFTANSTPWLTVEYNPQRPEQISIEARPIPLALVDRENMELHLYIDGSVIELFVNNEVAYTKRFYYAGTAPQDLCMKWTGKTENILSFSAWQLLPISLDRSTS
jgi:beta-fructofuranosidase